MRSTGEVEITQLTHSRGLGLWVTRWIADALGATLRFEDNEPRGSVVRLSLRAA